MQNINRIGIILFICALFIIGCNIKSYYPSTPKKVVQDFLISVEKGSYEKAADYWVLKRYSPSISTFKSRSDLKKSFEALSREWKERKTKPKIVNIEQGKSKSEISITVSWKKIKKDFFYRPSRIYILKKIKGFWKIIGFETYA